MDKKVVVYACGGFGINIGHMVEAQAKLKVGKGDDTKFAEIVVHYIDTSESNTKFRQIDKNVYLYDHLDGSGSDRTKNKDSISDSILDILIKHPPGDLNIVVNSTSGGSGSVIGPMLMGQLLETGKLAIAMATQSAATLKQLKNTVSVLATYESIASRKKKVLPLLLCDNEQDGENNVNATVTNAVVMLSILFSGHIERMDSADLEHWVNFDRVTSHGTGAVLFDIIYNAGVIPKNSVVCSVASLANGPETKTQFPQLVEYQTVGFISGNDTEEFKHQALHFVLIDGPVQQAYEERKKQLQEAEQVVSSRKTRKPFVSEAADDGGMVY